MLLIVAPDGSERRVAIAESTVNLGRSPDNQVRLEEASVSREHARLELEGDRFYLIDLASSNGTTVGGTRLEPDKRYTLEADQEFQIGGYRLRLQPARQPVSEVGEGIAPRPQPPVEPTADPAAADLGTPVRIGATDAPTPPPPPPVPPRPPGEDRPPDEGAFGLPPGRSRYLDYLPPIYEQDGFLGRYLLAFESVLAPLEQTVDSFDLYLDPQTVPAFFLDQLAGWLGMTLDEKWPEEKRRLLVVEAAELFRRRGTRWALSRYLEIYADVEPEITEPGERPHHFHVLLRLPAANGVDRATVERIIQANKPAHTTYSLEIRSGR
jgi:phage tail-like protein